MGDASNSEARMWESAAVDPGGYEFESPAFMRARGMFGAMIGGARSIQELDVPGGTLSRYEPAEAQRIILGQMYQVLQDLETQIASGHVPGIREEAALVATWACAVYESTFISPPPEDRK